MRRMRCFAASLLMMPPALLAYARRVRLFWAKPLRPSLPTPSHRQRAIPMIPGARLGAHPVVLLLWWQLGLSRSESAIRKGVPLFVQHRVVGYRGIYLTWVSCV